MIITCPECETRYTVKAAAFKAPGRKVRCANCGHEWFQAPPEDAPLSVDPAPEPAPEPAPPAPEPPSPDPTGPEPDEAGPEDSGARSDGAEEGVPEAPEEAPAAPAQRGAAAAGRAAPGAARTSRASVFGWIALLGFVALFCGAAAAFRGDIVRVWPATAALYEAVGLPVAVKGMEFRRVVYERTVENGLTVLAISGEIVNVGEERGTVPRVRVSLRDGEGAELYHYFFAIPEAELDAGASAEFVTRLSSPPAAARDLVLRFVEPGEFPEAAAAGGGS